MTNTNKRYDSERAIVLDLYVSGRGKEANRKKDSWNKRYPKNAIIITHDDIITRIEQMAKALREIKKKRGNND